jgi:nucleotide-binding universal stress UspA family protein
MKKVLFPFEISHTCYREAYVYAVKMARNLGAELIMLHAFHIEEVDNTITPGTYNTIIKNNWLSAYREIIRFHDYYLQDHARVDAELRVKTDHRIIHGNLVDEFRKILHSEEIDLVVLPAAGDTELTGKKIKLLRRETLDMDHTSLLAIPCEKIFLPIENMLFVTWMKRLKGLADYMNEIFLIASIYNSSIHYVHLSKHVKECLEIEEEIKQSIQKTRSRGNEIVFHCIGDRDPVKKLNEYITENDIRLLAIAKQQMHGFKELYLTSMFEEICSTVGIPVLVLRDSQV